MPLFFILCMLFICASIPSKYVMSWLFFSKPNNESSTHLCFPTQGAVFACSQLINFFFGYGLFYIAEQVLYYQSDTIILLSFFVIISGYFWSIFKLFKSNDLFFFFFLGIFTFFNTAFIIIFPVLFVLFSVFMNHVTLGYIVTFLAFFIMPLFFELEPLYILLNFILLTLFLVHQFKYILRAYSSDSPSLLDSFISRT